MFFNKKSLNFSRKKTKCKYTNYGILITKTDLNDKLSVIIDS